MPISSPFPCTSTKYLLYLSCNFFNALITYSPFSAACLGRFSFNSTLIVAIPAAQASGLPPNVVLCMNGFSSSTFQILLFDIKQLNGITPPPILLPRHNMSGTMFQCSHANILPVLPKPVCTSSKINRIPYLLHSCLTLGK